MFSFFWGFILAYFGDLASEGSIQPGHKMRIPSDSLPVQISPPNISNLQKAVHHHGPIQNWPWRSAAIAPRS